MKVLMVGHGGVYNRGCDAIIRASIRMLKENFKDLSITLATYDYDNDIKHDFGFPVKVVEHLDNSLWTRWSPAWWQAKFAKLLKRDIHWQLRFNALKPYVDDADIVLSIGGDNYTEDYGPDSLHMFLELNKYIKSKHKKLLIWGASLGKFSQYLESLKVAENLSTVDKILVREDESLHYLESLGLKNLIRVADPAFLLATKQISLPANVKEENKITVGFNVSPLLNRYAKSGSEGDQFLSEAVKFLSNLLTNENVNLILLPHVVDGKKGETDDLFYLGKVLQQLPMKERVFLPQSEFNSEELKYIISQCDYYIGARTHSTIAALSNSVPTISIGYSVKARGINQDIFGHLDYVLKSNDFTSEKLQEKYELLKSRGPEIRAHLQKRIPEIQAMSRKNVAAIVEQIK